MCNVAAATAWTPHTGFGLKTCLVSRFETRRNAFNSWFALRLRAATDTMIAWLMRGGAVWQLVGLITRRSQVQILPPLPRFFGRPPRVAFSFGEGCCR